MSETAINTYLKLKPNKASTQSKLTALWELDCVLDRIYRQCTTSDLMIMHLVSSRSRAIAAPCLYQTIGLTNRKQIVLLQRTLVTNRRLSLLVQCITIFDYTLSLEFMPHRTHELDEFINYVYGDVDIVQCLTSLLLIAPNLYCFHNHASGYHNAALLEQSDPHILWAGYWTYRHTWEGRELTLKPKELNLYSRRLSELDEDETYRFDLPFPSAFPKMSLSPPRSYRRSMIVLAERLDLAVFGMIEWVITRLQVMGRWWPVRLVSKIPAPTRFTLRSYILPYLVRTAAYYYHCPSEFQATVRFYFYLITGVISALVVSFPLVTKRLVYRPLGISTDELPMFFVYRYLDYCAAVALLQYLFGTRHVFTLVTRLLT